MNERTLNVTYEGKRHRMARYDVETSGPRPESYKEDYRLAAQFHSEEEKNAFYNDIKSAAESGWDFSTRWFTNYGQSHGEGSRGFKRALPGISGDSPGISGYLRHGI